MWKLYMINSANSMPMQSFRVRPSSTKVSQDHDDGEDTWLYTVLSQFTSDSSMHGMSHLSTSCTINNSRMMTGIKRTVWAIIILAALTYLLIQTINIFTQYTERNTLSTVTLQYQVPQDFPAITFCSTYNIKKHYLQKFKTRIQELADKWNLTTDEYYFTIWARQAIIQNMSQEERLNTGMEWGDIFSECWFRTIETCDVKDFTIIYTTDLGNCFTFNAGNFPESKQVFGSAIRHSLHVKVNASAIMSEYAPQPHSSFNQPLLRIHIHSRHAAVDIENPAGMNVGLMDDTSLSITKRQTKLLPSPYKTMCTNSDNEENKKLDYFYSALHDTHGIRYSNNQCQLTLLTLQQLKRCGGCMYLPIAIDKDARDLPAFQGINLNSSTVTCENNTIDDLLCQNGVWTESLTSDVSEYDDMPVCLQECNMETYDVKVASTLTSNMEGYYKNNTLHSFGGEITIMMSSMHYDYNEHIPAYGQERLLSNIGGLMGFFAGMSLMSLVEFVELLLDVLAIVVWRKKMCSI